MWIAYALLTIVFYIGLDFFIKKAAGRIDDFWATVVINSFSIIPALLVVLYLKVSNKEIFATKEGLVYSTLAGLSIGIGTITFIKLFATGANLSLASPLVRIGIILGTTLLGVLILKESFTLKQIIGMILSLTGLVLIFWK
ncbi:hypothetical protein A2Z22_04925 [Candidatus Woesebacteria bacterium RBG_16_34_12]|uniref:EamA domain-containing protein n=1 Tax=Candidatus Woesebacteria bacterium RBG_16_34_12 TaxID=1802480 RepID=A0A1F7XAE4_9BACT|nr:MAG: hypothetical protein A2Z22_04925 [Candidatus Woesebacteria bacterium RBG_16_34_12]